jgi:hypothetical protein
LIWDLPQILSIAILKRDFRYVGCFTDGGSLRQLIALAPVDESGGLNGDVFAGMAADCGLVYEHLPVVSISLA